jgi:hypothetical protein
MFGVGPLDSMSQSETLIKNLLDERGVCDQYREAESRGTAQVSDVAVR